MAWLILGVLVWSLVHPLRSVAAPTRASLISRLGDNGYQGAFSLVILASIVLMVVGWRSSVPTAVYLPPVWGRSAAIILMLAAFVLFAASALPTNIKRYVRHPQLTGAVVWAAAHLLSNGDSRSVVLFGAIGLWALIQMPLISRREGAWKKPDPVPLGAEVKVVIAGIVGYIVLLLAHPYLFGVAPITR